MVGVGIRDPAKSGDVIVMLPLQDKALSTSGDYERFFIDDGVRCRPIIHPGTGKLINEVRSAAILGADATTNNTLSAGVIV